MNESKYKYIVTTVAYVNTNSHWLNIRRWLTKNGYELNKDFICDFSVNNRAKFCFVSEEVATQIAIELSEYLIT